MVNQEGHVVVVIVRRHDIGLPVPADVPDREGVRFAAHVVVHGREKGATPGPQQYRERAIDGRRIDVRHHEIEL